MPYWLPMMDFWERIESLLDSSPMIIDRPAGTRHPNYPGVVYPLDYGYLQSVLGGDRLPLDVWRGHLADHLLIGVVCTVDTLERDGEFKLQLGCTDSEIKSIERFHTNEFMSCIVIRRN